MAGQGHSLVSVYNQKTKKLLRYEDSEGKTVAIVAAGGKLKVTSHGMIQGFYVRNNVLRREGQEAYIGRHDHLLEPHEFYGGRGRSS